MEENKNSSNETPAFGIAMFLFALVFIGVINRLPFPEEYGFWNLAGIFIGSCLIVAFVFGLAVGLITSVYKAIIEVMVAILLLLNAIYVSICWAFMDNIVEWMDIGVQNEHTMTIVILAVALFIFDLCAVIALLPFARIANSSIFD